MVRVACGIGLSTVLLAGACATAQQANNAPSGSSGATSDAAQSSGSGAPNGGATGVAGSHGSGGARPTYTACAKLKLDTAINVASSSVDRFTWQDADCNPRTASMARVAQGYLRQFTYQHDGKTRTATGTGTNGWQGWGYAINHGLGGGGAAGGQFRTVFVGAHHAIYEYSYEVSSSLPITIDWLFATGRDNPVVAITYDMTKRSPGINADTRTPYGDLAWDGDENWQNTVVSGVAWGDHYKFVSTKAPLTLNSTWDYSAPNLVPYCLEWADASDSEMGAVATQTYKQHDGGGYWGYKDWGKTSDNQVRDTGQLGVMPRGDSSWAFQLNQYELCFPVVDGCLGQTTHSHRVAWGANYGAVGGVDASGKYPAFGETATPGSLKGYPYQSYSVFMVLGKHTTKTVFAQVHEIEVVQKTQLTASVGTVALTGPAGVGRQDSITLAPPGYDHRYSAWRIQAAQNRAQFQINVGQDSLVDPVIVVTGFTSANVPAVRIDGAAATPDADFFASLDSTGQQLWITLRGNWAGKHEISVG